MKRIFAWPGAIALLSLIGLIAGLVGDGAMDLLAWAGLAAPVLAIAWAMRYRSR
jgi:hypothetical protein